MGWRIGKDWRFKRPEVFLHRSNSWHSCFRKKQSKPLVLERTDKGGEGRTKILKNQKVNSLPRLKLLLSLNTGSHWATTGRSDLSVDRQLTTAFKRSRFMFGPPGGPFGPPYPLDPYRVIDPLTGRPIGTIESTLDAEGINRQLIDDQGNVLLEQNIPPRPGD